MTLIYSTDVTIYWKLGLVSIKGNLFKIINTCAIRFCERGLFTTSNFSLRKLYSISRVDSYAFTFNMNIPHIYANTLSFNARITRTPYTLFLVKWVLGFQTCFHCVIRTQKFLRSCIQKRRFKIALAMALHPRLGAASSLSYLGNDLIHYIAYFV